MARVTPSAIMELIKTTAAGDYISFASGLPDPALYPVDTLRAISDDVLCRDGRAALQYGPAEGYPPLRELVAELLRGRGLPATPEHVLITNGSQQALDLAARALLDPGDRVILESPSYLAAVQAFDSYGAAYHTLPMDGDGLVTEALGPALASGARLLYTLPNFQNPTGITLSGPRRSELAERAAAVGVPVLEDDAYHDLRYEGEPLPPVCALAPNPGAVYTGTFSKTIAPGVRVGYLWAAPELVTRLGQLKQITDLHTGSLTQRVVYQYCAQGHMEPGIRRFCESYAARRDVLLEELERHAAGLIRWTRPSGGMFVWCTLPAGRSAAELLERAMARGVVFEPGASFHPGGGGENTFRLNFVSATEARIREGIRILGEVLREGLDG
ncbi:MAG: Aromatic-amino-acid aminotransferase [Armatimonadetes bacterium]|nr:Aromatic-amino-acid aminotransferase [Armatimonadota bacterium]